MTKLNPLLKLAAIAGVETAIKLHIRRGDDLNARDGAGATPLILAAGKRRLGAVRLLLDAGADPIPYDESGMDALAHAVKAGCPETVALLTDALSRLAEPESMLHSGGQTPRLIINELESGLAKEKGNWTAPKVDTPTQVPRPATVAKLTQEISSDAFETQRFEKAPVRSDDDGIQPDAEVVVLDDEPLGVPVTGDNRSVEHVAAPPVHGVRPVR